MNKKEQFKKKFKRQEEIVNGVKAARRDYLTEAEQAEFDALQRDIDTLKTEIEEEDNANNESQRAAEITTLCRDFGVDPAEHINTGASVAQVRAAVLEKLKTERKLPGAKITADEADKFRDAAVDAILSRAGINVQDPAPGYRDLMGVRLTGFASECVLRKGIQSPQRLDEDILIREALSPDSQFGGILSNAANKAMAVSYKAAGTTFQKWTRKGSNPDFKATMQYQISEAGELLPVTQSGEFKFDEVTDQGVRKVIATFGRGWGLTRQAIINDDIGALTKTPAAYARAAARGINRLVYMQLGANPVIYDSVPLFNAAHGNVAAAPGAINVANVGSGKAAMRQQRGLRGLEALNIGPKFLLVPAARETVAQQFISRALVATTQGAVNPLANILEPVVDAELDPYSLTAWYLAADPHEADTIEVTYLNEKDLPTIESQVGFDYLGVKWRIFIDYGVTVCDFRGLYMDAGI
ncbi:MAG: Mu-like prophage major head subunit gpT family protein [Dehalobacter sp.]|nr:Mu-like prophage major head subunit gpT family protein [Dehalobacter sp.]